MHPDLLQRPHNLAQILSLHVLYMLISIHAFFFLKEMGLPKLLQKSVCKHLHTFHNHFTLFAYSFTHASILCGIAKRKPSVPQALPKVLAVSDTSVGKQVVVLL